MILYNPFRFSSDESLYLAPQIPLTLSISAASAEKRKSQIMMPPPPCVTLWTICLGLCALFHFGHIFSYVCYVLFMTSGKLHAGLIMVSFQQCFLFHAMHLPSPDIWSTQLIVIKSRNFPT